MSEVLRRQSRRRLLPHGSKATVLIMKGIDMRHFFAAIAPLVISTLAVLVTPADQTRFLVAFVIQAALSAVWLIASIKDDDELRRTALEGWVLLAFLGAYLLADDWATALFVGAALALPLSPAAILSPDELLVAKTPAYEDVF